MKAVRWLAVLCCLIAGDAAAQTAPLRVLIWPDYLAPGTVEAFTAETGIEVIVDTYESSSRAEALLQARGSGYDIAVVSSEFIGRLGASGALRPLDPALLPPLDTLDPALMARLDALDPGHRYARPYLWGTLGIGYDARAVAARLGDVPVDTWSLVFDPATVALLADCGVALVDSVEEVVAAAILWRGGAPNARTGTDTATALADLAAMSRHVSAYTTSFVETLARGDFCVLLGWSGDILAAADEAAEGRDLRFVVPREGGLVWADLFVVPVDAPQPASAHRFIAHMLEPAVSAAAMSYNWTASPVRAAHALADPAVRDHPALHPTPDDWARLVMLRSIPPARQAALLSAWTHLRVGTLLDGCLADCASRPQQP